MSWILESGGRQKKTKGKERKGFQLGKSNIESPQQESQTHFVVVSPCEEIGILTSGTTLLNRRHFLPWQDSDILHYLFSQVDVLRCVWSGYESEGEAEGEVEGKGKASGKRKGKGNGSRNGEVEGGGEGEGEGEGGPNNGKYNYRYYYYLSSLLFPFLPQIPPITHFGTNIIPQTILKASFIHSSDGAGAG